MTIPDWNPLPITSPAKLSSTPRLDVKYQGAHYILSRGTHKERGTSEEPFPLKVKIDAARKISVIEKTFTRQERDPGFLLDWRIDLKTCNPGCPY